MSPRHIAYTIWTTIALLGAVCLLAPEGGWTIGQWTLRWPTLSQALDLSDTTDTCVVTPPTDTIPLTTAPTQAPEQTATVTAPAQPKVKPTPTTDTDTIIPMIDARHYLTAFYQALDSADRMPVRVVHYGDSQIEEDRISSILRELWQKEYGGGGVGLLVPAGHPLP